MLRTAARLGERRATEPREGKQLMTGIPRPIILSHDMPAQESEEVASRWWRVAAWSCALYVVLTALTAATFLADTVVYAASIESKFLGDDSALWEIGHLLWRPLGWLATWLIGPWVARLAGIGRFETIVRLLIAMNWIAGLVAVVGMARLTRGLGLSSRISAVVVAAFSVSFGVLQFVHSGAPYIPALACLIACLALQADGERWPRGWRPALAGCFLAGAMGFWAPFVLTAPAALVFAPIWFGFDRRRLWATATMAVVCGALLGLAYAFAIARLGIHDLQGFRAWAAEASHGIVRVGGVKRMIFGFPRSFLTMGDDGVLVKRYLLHDPYNPVSLGELIRLSLAKVAFFYLVILATVIQLGRTARGRRAALILLLGGGPVLAFAAYWQGGDVERYLSLYPLIFLAWGVVLEDGRRGAGTWAGILVATFFIVMAISNAMELRSATRDGRRAAITERTEVLRPLLGENDRVFLVDLRDPLSQLSHDPLFPLFQTLRVKQAIYLGNSETHLWREKFEDEFKRVSENGGRVWISKRLLSPRPRPEWLWVEGEDPVIRWEEIPAFFQRFAVERELGGDDGFFLLEAPESAPNGRTAPKSEHRENSPTGRIPSNGEPRESVLAPSRR